MLCLGLAACGNNDPKPNETITEPASDTKPDSPAKPPTAEIYNNGGHYAKHNGAVYYWENTAGTIEPVGLWGEFPEIPYASRAMVRLNADGGKEVLFTGQGHGPIWIYGGRFYLQTADEDYRPQLYSIAMDGNAASKRALGPGEIFALDEARGLLVAREYMGGRLFALDAATGESLDLAADAEPLLYEGGALYYRDYSGGEPGILKLSRADIVTGAVREIAEIDLERYEGFDEGPIGLEFGCPRLDEEDEEALHVLVAAYGGTAHMYYNCVAFTVDMAGDAVLVNESPVETDWFGVDRPFQYEGDGPFASDEADITYYIHHNLFGAPEPVLTREDLAFVGLPEGGWLEDADFSSLQDIEYADGALFFTVYGGIRNEAEDVGWRWAYYFESAQVFRKDLAAGTIEPLYRFDKYLERGD
jgi:hypothetical protein